MLFTNFSNWRYYLPLQLLVLTKPFPQWVMHVKVNVRTKALLWWLWTGPALSAGERSGRPGPPIPLGPIPGIPYITWLLQISTTWRSSCELVFCELDWLLQISATMRLIPCEFFLAVMQTDTSPCDANDLETVIVLAVWWALSNHANLLSSSSPIKQDMKARAIC